tara:strand:+ start:502 stop:1317 length:816 start_codon:yes stop_codon:yes gene_type:complete
MFGCSSSSGAKPPALYALEEEKKELQKDNDNKSTRIYNLEASISSLKKDNSRLNTRIDTLSALERTNRSLSATLNTRTSERDRLEGRIQCLKSDIDTKEDIIQRLKSKVSDYDSIESEKNRLKRDKQTKEREITRLQLKCSTLESQVQSISKERDTLKTYKDAHITVLEDAVDARKKAQTEKEDAQKETETIRAQKIDLIRKNEHAESIRESEKNAAVLNARMEAQAVVQQNTMKLLQVVTGVVSSVEALPKCIEAQPPVMAKPVITDISD